MLLPSSYVFAPWKNLNYSSYFVERFLNIVYHNKEINSNLIFKVSGIVPCFSMRIFEAVFHFSLYEYLSRFLSNKKAKILPEFPTGNGAIDLIIRYQDRIYGLGLKSYTNDSDFRESLKQAARYAETLNLTIDFQKNNLTALSVRDILQYYLFPAAL